MIVTSVYQISFDSKYIPVAVFPALSVITLKPILEEISEQKIDTIKPPLSSEKTSEVNIARSLQVKNVSLEGSNNKDIIQVHDTQSDKVVIFSEASIDNTIKHTLTSSTIHQNSQQNPLAPTPKKTQTNTINQQHIQKILHFIRYKIEKSAKKNYPLLAQKRQMEGKVLLRFSINESGNIQNSEILERSGYAILDASALKALKDAAPFPYLQQEIEVPIEFTVSKESEFP